MMDVMLGRSDWVSVGIVGGCGDWLVDRPHSIRHGVANRPPRSSIIVIIPNHQHVPALMNAQSDGMSPKAGVSLSPLTRLGCERMAQMGRSVASPQRQQKSSAASRLSTRWKGARARVRGIMERGFLLDGRIGIILGPGPAELWGCVGCGAR